MGWNTWNKYGCSISEDDIISNAKVIKSLGLDKLGYVYVNIDDCWQLEQRDENQKVQVDMERFP
jgi:alpha-galactosidase